MIEKFRNHLLNNFSFLEGKKLLLATSGGLDSMVMAHLFCSFSKTIALAHCNFKLRGQESDEDQKFVKEFAEQHSIPFFTTQFETSTFAKQHKQSIQVAARDLRYSWFYELVKIEKYDYIITAHQADDVLETFLINLIRGTGLEGLTGIPTQNNLVVRPLLPFSRLQLHEFALANTIAWREDSSNASNYYMRNKIRHELVPTIKEVNPNFLSTFQNTISYLSEAQNLVGDASDLIYKKVVVEEENSIYIDINALKQQTNYKSYLYQWLSKYGFTAWEDLFNLVEAQSGKQVFASEYRIVKNRNQLIVSAINKEDTQIRYYLHENQNEINIPLKLKLSREFTSMKSNNSTIFVDENKLVFPLEIRKWKVGDTFRPSGMQGKSKKISKFFKDEKMSILEKETTWLLCSGSEIIWIIGIRQDERFKTTASTTNILQIALL